MAHHEGSKEKRKIVGTSESWYRLIIIVSALGAYLFYMLLFPPPVLSIFPDISESLPTVAILFLWVDWGIYLTFFIILVCLILASPTFIMQKHRAEVIVEGEIFQRVKQLSAMLRLKKPPAILLEESNRALCIVFGTFFRQQRLLISTQLIKSLDSSELEAVLLHELSHIKNRDVGIATWGDYLKSAAKYGVIIILVLRIVILTIDLANGSFPDVVNIFIDLPSILILTMIIPIFVINSGLRKREFLADARASLFLTGSSALKSAMVKTVLVNYRECFASSNGAKVKLENKRSGFYSVFYRVLVEPLGMRFSKWFSVHPTIKQRTIDIDEEKHIFSSGKINLPGNETMVLSGIASMYMWPAGTFLLAFPLYLALHLGNAAPSLVLLVSLCGVFLFLIAPGILIFLPIYESMKGLNHSTLGLLSRMNRLRYIFSLGKAVTVASLVNFIFSSLASGIEGFSVESLIVKLYYALAYAAITVVLFTASLLVAWRRK